MKKITLLMLILVLAACEKSEQDVTQSPIVLTYSAQSASEEQQKIYPGIVKGRYEVLLAFQHAGKVKQRYIERGQLISTDMVLAELDEFYSNESLKSSEAQLKQLQEQFRLIAQENNRQRKLARSRIISPAQYEQHLSQYEEIKSQLKQAEAAYAKDVRISEEIKLKSDFAGVVTSVNVEPGQVVSAGQPIIGVTKTDELEVEIHVSERHINHFHAKQPVRVSFWAQPEKPVEGFIREISPVADPQTRTFSLRIAIPSSPDYLKLGMTASVMINLSATDNALVKIPYSALYQSGSATQVWLVKDNRVYLQPVELERFDTKFALIKKGLNEGDKVVSAGLHQLAQGMTVRTKTPYLKDSTENVQ